MIKYRKQKYSCCQLIAAINARIFLGGGNINDNKFEKLVELTGCKSGACIRIKEIYPNLKLDYIDMDKRLNKLKWIKNNLPVEISYFDEKRGFHSALIVKVKDDILHLVNSSKKTRKWKSIKFPKYTYNQRFRSFTLIKCVKIN